MWTAFLDRIMDGDAGLIGYLQRLAGYSLTGYTTEHSLAFFYGTGANGKSVFIETMTGILADYATVAPAETFLESRSDKHPTDMAPPIKNPHGSLAARYAHVFGYWCSKKFEIIFTRTQFMTRNRAAKKGIKFPITKIDFQNDFFRIYYLDKKSNEEVAYEFDYNSKQSARIHLRRIYYRGTWRNVSSKYSRKC